MPYTSIYCTCEGRKFALTHYERGECKHPPLYLPRLIGMVRGMTRPRPPRPPESVAVTALTGCPREYLIRREMECYLDPRGHLSTHWGSLTHEWCAQHVPPGAFMEVRFPAEGQEPPRLFGLDLVGVVDYDPNRRTLEDLKCHGEGAQGYKDPAIEGREAWKKKYWEVDMGTACQLNIYRMCREQLGLRAGRTREELELVAMIAHHEAMVGSSGPAGHVEEVLPFLTEEQIAAHRPMGGEYTVGEIARMLVEHAERVAGGMGMGESIALVPLVGRSMIPDKKTGVGKKCGSWCGTGVKGVCDVMAGVESVEARVARATEVASR